MDVTVSEAAKELNLDERTVRAHVTSGRLQVTRVIGRTQLLEYAGVKALQRGSGRGRLWNARTVWAALELLDSGATERVTGSERSRLRARLGSLDVARFAYLASGRGQLRRLSQVSGTTTTLRERLLLSGVTLLESDEVAAAFDLASSRSRRTVGYVHDLEAFALRNALVESADGEVFLRDLATADEVYLGLATYALDLFELGDTRESSAGARYLTERMR